MRLKNIPKISHLTSLQAGKVVLVATTAAIDELLALTSVVVEPSIGNIALTNNIGIVGEPERFGRKRITVMSCYRPNVVWQFVKHLPFAIQSAILT